MNSKKTREGRIFRLHVQRGRRTFKSDKGCEESAIFCLQEKAGEGCACFVVKLHSNMKVAQQMADGRTGAGRGHASGGGWAALALGALVVFLLASPAGALTVEIDIGWGYNDDWNSDAEAEAGLRDTYHLQEGSIVQVIMFNYTANPSYDFADGPASDNFNVFGSTTMSTSAAPFETWGPPTNAPHIPDDQTVYDPNTVPEGHVIAYEFNIGDSVNTGPGGDYWYNHVAQFTILGTWDQLYIRVFGATEWEPQGTAIASYWGLSTVQTNPFAAPGVWLVPMGDLDDVKAVYTNYFEVIPEPGVLALIGLGGAGLLAGRRRRRKSDCAG